MISPNEISFLKELQEAFSRYAEEARDVEEEMEYDIEKATVRLRELLAKIKQTELALREKHHIDRFKVFPRELQQMIDKVEIAAPIILKNRQLEANQSALSTGLQEDEMYVYIYLFNAQGSNLLSWQKLVTASALQEHAVSRPIYPDLQHLEEILRTKPFIEQHGYLEIKVKKADIIDNLGLKDNLGHQVVRLKEGAIQSGNVIRFHHRDNDYVLMFKGTITVFEPIEVSDIGAENWTRN